MSFRATFQTRSALGNTPPLNTLSSSLGSGARVLPANVKWIFQNHVVRDLIRS